MQGKETPLFVVWPPDNDTPPTHPPARPHTPPHTTCMQLYCLAFFPSAPPPYQVQSRRHAAFLHHWQWPHQDHRREVRLQCCFILHLPSLDLCPQPGPFPNSGWVPHGPSGKPEYIHTDRQTDTQGRKPSSQTHYMGMWLTKVYTQVKQVQWTTLHGYSRCGLRCTATLETLCTVVCDTYIVTWVSALNLTCSVCHIF